MIEFTTLYIDNNSTKLSISANVKDLSYYTNIYIDSVIIDTQDTYIASGPSSSAIYTYPVTGNNKSITLELDQLDLPVSLKNTLFFVYIKAKGTPASDTPCGLDNTYTMSPVYNQYPVYQYQYTFLKNLEGECTIPKEFINAYLRYQSIDISIKTGHYTSTCKYWKKFFMNIPTNITTSKSCGCNG